MNAFARNPLGRNPLPTIQLHVGQQYHQQRSKIIIKSHNMCIGQYIWLHKASSTVSKAESTSSVACYFAQHAALILLDQTQAGNQLMPMDGNSARMTADCHV